jgi:putative lipoprotein
MNLRLLFLLLPFTALANDEAATISEQISGGLQQAQSAVVPAAASSFLEINGTASTLLRIALPRDAMMRVRIEDRGRKGKALTLAEQTYDLAGVQLPVPFNVTVDRDLVGKRSKLFVTARIIQKNRSLFVGESPVDPDSIQTINIVLRPASPKIAH